MSTVDEQTSTGIKGADEFRAAAQKLGLTVETKVTTSEPVLFEDGREMLPGSTNVMLTVSLPVPESLGNNMLTVTERATALRVCWKRDHNGRARGRWILGNYSTLGGHTDMHMLRTCHTYLNIMAGDLRNLERLANAG